MKKIGRDIFFGAICFFSLLGGIFGMKSNSGSCQIFFFFQLNDCVMMESYDFYKKTSNGSYG